MTSATQEAFTFEDLPSAVEKSHVLGQYVTSLVAGTEAAASAEPAPHNTETLWPAEIITDVLDHPHNNGVLVVTARAANVDGLPMERSVPRVFFVQNPAL